MAWESSLPILKSMMDPSGSGQHTGSDDEDSFVVLESSPSMLEDLSDESANGEVTPSFRTNKVREMQSLLKLQISEMNESKAMPELPSAINTVEAVSASIGKVVISPDASHEEIQKQVEELIKENETLKNTIAQNNLSMKSQYSRFLSYKDEVVNVMKSYKEKFNEAKSVIDKYKEENAKLASEVEVYINIKKLHEEEIINLKERNKPEISSNVGKPDNEIPSELQTELAQANLKITELLATNAKIDTEIQNLKSLNEDLQTKLNTTSNSLQSVNVEKQALLTKLDNLRKLENDVVSYQQTIEKLTERLISNPKLEDQLQTKEQEINVCKFDISTLNNEVTKLKNQNAALTDQLKRVSTQSTEMVQSANIASNLQLNLKEAEIVDLRQELENSRARESTQLQELSGLQTKCKELKIKVIPTIQEDYKQVRQQLSISQQTITALETEQEKTAQEIDRLRKLIQESDNDEIFALKEQLTLYKNDFEAEKESKTALKREKDQIAEDLQNVQTRNKQLQNEVETLRARMQPKTEGYECPKCSSNFTTYQSLENHVHRCLDMDMFP